MSLTVVSVPIGNFGDITLRAIETLRNCDLIICEELKPAKVLLKRLNLPEKEFLQLNEHSKSSDLRDLIDICRKQNVALISDSGTLVFATRELISLKGAIVKISRWPSIPEFQVS